MRIVIVGAGISGLALAYRLKDRHDVSVLEASSRAGGNIRTFTEKGFTWEAGPNGFLDSKPSTLQLCKDLGLGDQLIAASEGSRKNRYLCLNGSLVKLPSSPQGLLTTKALSLRGKLSLILEPLRRRGSADGESVHDFAVRRFGREAAATIVDALVTGIHGGDPKLLELASAFPRLAKFEAEQGSVFQGFRNAAKARSGPARMWSFTGGMQRLTDALARSLGEHLKLNTPVERLEKRPGGWAVNGTECEAVVLTVPAPVQAKLLDDFHPGFAIELNAIPHNRIAVVALGYRAADVPMNLDGFGYIAPQNTRRDVLGVQWCSSIFPGRAPEGHVLWRALCGGVHRGELLDLNDEKLIATVHSEMQAVMKVKGEPVFRRIQRWPRAIPQYLLGHGARVKRVEALAAKHPGLHLAGNAFHGIAVNDCTEQAGMLAARFT